MEISLRKIFLLLLLLLLLGRQSTPSF